MPDPICLDTIDVSAGSRHIFIILDDGTAVVSGYIESFADYRGHMGVLIDENCDDDLLLLCVGYNPPLQIF